MREREREREREGGGEGQKEREGVREREGAKRERERGEGIRKREVGKKEPMRWGTYKNKNSPKASGSFSQKLFCLFVWVKSSQEYIEFHKSEISILLVRKYEYV